MMPRTRLLTGTALTAMIAATQSARADLIQWTVSGDFSDGGTFSGSFTYDNAADSVTQWSLATSSGTASVGPNSYSGSASGSSANADSGNDVNFANVLVPDFPYATYAVLDFNDLPYGAPGSVATLTGSEVVEVCVVIGPCGTPSASRTITSGTAVGTDVPEPATGALVLAGIGLLGVYRRRRRTAV